MAWLIMNDAVDYPATWYPTHIVSKDKKLLRIYIGASQTMLSGFVGLWINDEDYNKIYHDKAYILIHNPDAVSEDIIDIDWDKIEDVKFNNNSVEREHYHIWKDIEWGEK